MQTLYGKRVFGLDLIRATAISLVVFSHLSWIVPNAQGIIRDLMAISGVIGVEIFFVLSGFLIGKIIYRLYTSDDFSFKIVAYFWVRRWFRTLPNYYLALLLNVALTLYIGLNLPSKLWTYFFFVQNFSSEIPYFFMESWSLSIEEFAYLIGPLLLYFSLFIKTTISKSQQFLFVTLAIIGVFFVTKCYYAMNDDVKTMVFWNSNLKALVIYRIDAVYYGVFAAYVSIVKLKFWQNVKYVFFVLSVLMLAAINILVPIFQLFIESHSVFWNVFYLPLNSIAILLALPLFSQLHNCPKILGKPITFISVTSYAIYVLHYSIILQWMKYKWPTENLSKFDIGIYIVTYLGLTILASYMLYRLFEKPMTDIRDTSKITKFFK
jgi:peptidoglycan/LPS O-acetylase OafA/YrhL